MVFNILDIIVEIVLYQYIIFLLVAIYPSFLVRVIWMQCCNKIGWKFEFVVWEETKDY